MFEKSRTRTWPNLRCVHNHLYTSRNAWTTIWIFEAIWLIRWYPNPNPNPNSEPEPELELEPEPFGPNSELKFGFGTCLRNTLLSVVSVSAVACFYFAHSHPHPFTFISTSEIQNLPEFPATRRTNWKFIEVWGMYEFGHSRFSLSDPCFATALLQPIGKFCIPDLQSQPQNLFFFYTL